MADDEKEAGSGYTPPGATHDHETELFLSEPEAWQRARAAPGRPLPIRLVFGPGDRSHPRHWPAWRRWYVCGFASWLNVLVRCRAASRPAASRSACRPRWPSLYRYILGFALGPPLSEHHGRRPVYVASWLGLVLVLAPNLGAVLACRFAGSAPLTNTGGSISDLFRRDESGAVMAVYGAGSTNLGWRTVFWILMATTGAFWLLLACTVPETRHGIVLKKKAARVRRQMARERLATARSLRDANADHRDSLRAVVNKILTRPVYFLLAEPITIFAALYNGLVFLFNEAFPLVFGPGGHGFDVGQVGLSFLGLTVGPMVAFCFYPLQERYYLSRVAANNGKGVPEARVWMAHGGALLIPSSLFWFAWTSYPSVHWIVPIIASAFFGAGICIIILSIVNYVVDAYQTYSASALAGVILVRNLTQAGFPLFANRMYKRLGNEWASSLLGFLAILLVPIPFILFYRGEAIRFRSPWAREHADQDEDAPH
ncbi:major facilitator superfamily domain-containing protein [Xylariomycetidae sp. FL0641]|nr:major facilitator superfamily domain-containing protein [Xylariomycetidae sp. FL0641]